MAVPWGSVRLYHGVHPTSKETRVCQATTRYHNFQEKGPLPLFTQRKEQMIEIDCRDRTSESVTFLVDGKHFMSSSSDGKIRRWRVEDGEEVGTPMEVSETILDVAVSRDGKWVVSGLIDGGITVWNAESHDKVPTKFKTDVGMVFAVDVSPDGSKVATGSGDSSACVWSLLTGERLLGPLEHDNVVVGVSFSPDGLFIATVTEDHSNSIRIYDSQNGCLLVDFPITISDSAASNQLLVWARDCKQLFALSRDGNINCLDVPTGTTLSQWPIHNPYPPTSIALASNGKFVAVAADTSLSFWDTTTLEKIGSFIEQKAPIKSMSISAKYDIVTTTGYTISLFGLRDILPSSYIDIADCDKKYSPAGVEYAGIVETTKPPHAQNESSDGMIAHLEREISRIDGENVHLKETVASLVSDIHDLRDKGGVLEVTVRDLRTELAESKRNADRAIESLRARNESLDQKIARLEATLQDHFSQLDNPRDTTKNESGP